VDHPSKGYVGAGCEQITRWHRSARGEEMAVGKVGEGGRRTCAKKSTPLVSPDRHISCQRKSSVGRLVSKQDDGVRRIAEEATSWLDSLDEDYSVENRTRFVMWLKTSAAHVGAFLSAAAWRWEQGKCPARSSRRSHCLKRNASEDDRQH
jgi:hypothetical protein